jgi:hypothetical protein
MSRGLAQGRQRAHISGDRLLGALFVREQFITEIRTIFRALGN